MISRLNEDNGTWVSSEALRLCSQVQAVYMGKLGFFIVYDASE